MDELRKIIKPDNCQYISEVKGSWETYSNVQFYGVMKEVMKPPRTLNGGKALFNSRVLNSGPQGPVQLNLIKHT